MLNKFGTRIFAGIVPVKECEKRKKSDMNVGLHVSRKNHRGASIFSVVLGIAVAGVVALGLTAVYQNVITTVRSQSVLTDMAVIEATIRRVHASTSAYAGSSALHSAATTPWGGAIYTGAGKTEANFNTAGGPGSSTHFFLSALELPESACETVASAYLDRPDVEDVYVENHATTPAFATTDKVATAGAVLTKCLADNNNHVAVTFKG